MPMQMTPGSPINVRPARQSIQPTYDITETGPRYWLSSFVDERPIDYQKRLNDPFVTTTIHVCWRDLVKAVFRRKELTVRVQVGGDHEVIEDVMELNSDYLGMNCTRRNEFHGGLNAALGRFAGGDDD